MDPMKKAVDLKRNAVDKLKEYRRVLRISEKPDREEFEMAAKITGAGMLLIGAIGFVFYIVANLLPQYV